MSITDELREWAVNHRAELDMGQLYPAMIHDIADRIDAAHENGCKEQFVCGAEHGIGASIEASMIQERGWIKATDENMAEHGWVRLPLDADGVPIRIGDTVRYDTTGKPFEVKEICYMDGYETEVGNGEQYGSVMAGCVHHYHPPTVEDVLREFALRAIRDSESNCGDLDETCAEYAKKLRLAGEDE